MLNDPIAQFELSRRTSRGAYRRLQRIGIVCLLLIGFITVGWPTQRRYPLWMLLGLCVGLYGLVKGGHDLFFTDHPRTRIGDRLAHASDRWFPPLAFLAEHGYIILAALAFWLSLVHLGFEAEWQDHFVFIGLATLVPLKRITTVVYLRAPGRMRLVLDELVRVLVFITLLVAGVRLAYVFWVPGNARYAGGVQVPMILIWLTVCLAVLTQLVLSATRLTSNEPLP